MTIFDRVIKLLKTLMDHPAIGAAIRVDDQLYRQMVSVKVDLEMLVDKIRKKRKE